MERKTIQRIIGILVMIAIILVLLPLFLNKENRMPDGAAIKAPPFPDEQAAPVAVPAPQPAVIPQPVTDDSAITLNNTPASAVESVSTVPVNNASMEAAPSVEKVSAVQPVPDNKPSTTKPLTETVESPVVVATEDGDTVIKINHPIESSRGEEHPSENVTVINPKQQIPTDSSTPIVTVERQDATAEVKPVENNTVETKPVESNTVETKAVETKHVEAKASVRKQATPKAVAVKSTENKFIPVFKPAKAYKPAQSSVADKTPTDNKAKWAVQLGSFNNKSNAIKLTEKMRTAGFAVFTREKGQSTRVYIGPELKQASAIKISNKVEQDMNIHGIIVPYNKLEG